MCAFLDGPDFAIPAHAIAFQCGCDLVYEVEITINRRLDSRAKRRVTVREFHGVFYAGPLVRHFIGDCIHGGHPFLFQPLPNTEPGLAGETGVSRDSGTVDDSDGLKTGAGLLMTGGGALLTGELNRSPM
jgi:hypothetical protein